MRSLAAMVLGVLLSCASVAETLHRTHHPQIEKATSVATLADITDTGSVAQLESCLGPNDSICTGQASNMAIVGEGLFEVTLADGRTAYTRTGNFVCETLGHLVTPAGCWLTQNISISNSARYVAIATTGEVMGLLPGASNSSLFGTVHLTRFSNPAGLVDAGQNRYRQNDTSGTPQYGQPRINGMGVIMAGNPEDSHMSVVTELFSLNVVQRAYDLTSTGVLVTNQMREAANQRIY